TRRPTSACSPACARTSSSSAGSSRSTDEEAAPALPAMHCPFCQHDDTRVIDSRVSEDGSTIRRRRECPGCGERFNTFETAELKLPAIVKSDGRREAFDERKLRTSFERALQ